jgi:hypothetical protein
MSIAEQNRVQTVEIAVEQLRAQFAELKQTVDALVDIRAREREAKVNKEARHGTAVRRGAEGRKQAS